MGTDRYAYASRLRRVEAVPKLWLTLGALILCISCGSAAVGLVTLALMGALTVGLGGQRAATLVRFLRLPLAFLAVGCLPIVFRPLPAGEGALWAAEVFGRFRWGVTAEYLRVGLTVFCKALGAVSAMYFLSLNTPMTDLTQALERLHVPKLLVELMELIYRFLFVFSDTARRIRVAQESRLGYQTAGRGLRSLGELASSLFLRAWRQADRSYTALESRGYTGALNTLPAARTPGRWLYGVLAAVAAVQILTWMAERSWLQ